MMAGKQLRRTAASGFKMKIVGIKVAGARDANSRCRNLRRQSSIGNQFTGMQMA